MNKILFMLVPFVMSFGLIAVFFFIMRSIRKRGDAQAEYLYRKDQGHYYFDNGKLVINVAPPYRPWTVLVDEIDHAVLLYDLLSFGKNTLGFEIVKKDGTVAKGPGFVVYSHQFSLEDTLGDLQAHGVQCRSGKKGMLGNRAK